MKGTTIYYRGFLKSCNYRCSYCPFSKNPVSQKQIGKDREALERFCRRAEQLEDVGIMFLPYGEALIHSYYLEQLERLGRQDNIRFVACQTNLSFDMEAMLSHRINPGKLKLWCSFHPSQTTVDAFVSQCRKLKKQGIRFSAGAVGDPANLPVIRELRKQLDSDVYLWINDLDGRKRAYTDKEAVAFAEIDPLFALELKKLPADMMQCRAGKDAVFVNGRGEVYACNISKVLMGNIYEDEPVRPAERGCRSKACSCYLAYSNRLDLEELKVFGRNYPFRIPDSGRWESGMESAAAGIRAFFFDVDGTLTDSDGVIQEDTQAAVRGLAGKCRIYLATSLPYQEARRKCKPLWDCLDGGAFADGSDIRIFSTGYDETIPLERNPFVDGSGRVRKYHKDGVLHKIMVLNPDSEPAIEAGNAVDEDGRISVTSPDADKLKAVLRICGEMEYREDEVAVYGNSMNDIGLLKHFKHSFAVTNSCEEVKRAAGQVCDICQWVNGKPPGNGV